MGEAVEIRWWGDRSRALVVYATAFAATLTVLALRTGQFQPVHRVLMGASALFCLYYAAARVVNATTIRVSGERLVVRHGPLPWRGGMSVALSQIEELTVDAGQRVHLRTTQGEEVPVVDELRERSASRIGGQLRALIGKAAASNGAAASDGAAESDGAAASDGAAESDDSAPMRDEGNES